MLIGQEKLTAKINKLNLDTFPHSLLLVGSKGSGKHTICDYISKHLELDIIDITDKISLDTITDITLRSEPAIYLIDGSLLSEKKENVLLKFIEEPLKNSFIVILCEFEEQLLPTIRNRCQTWKMEFYTKDQLANFTQDSWLLEIASTPGMIKKLQDKDNLVNLVNLINTIIDKIGNANYANTLTIVDKISFNNEPDKYDLDIFIDFMMHNIRERVKRDEGDYHKLMNIYCLTDKLYNAKYIPHINMQYEFYNYLTNLKKALQN